MQRESACGCRATTRERTPSSHVGSATMARQRVPEGPPAVPPVQKLRIRYAKRGRLRFSSTRDFQRALERALRRAGVPTAYSAGFHPHPKISYANAAPTGVASEAEYVEISVVQRLDPLAVRDALDAALPEGLDVVEVVEAKPGALAELLQASLWRLEFAGLPQSELHAACAQFTAQETIEVTRTFKNGPRTFDARGAVIRLEVGVDESGCAILHMVVRHTTPAVRPDDVLNALRTAAGLTPPRPPLVTRLAQGPLQVASATVADPLAADSDVAGA